MTVSRQAHCIVGYSIQCIVETRCNPPRLLVPSTGGCAILALMVHITDFFKVKKNQKTNGCGNDGKLRGEEGSGTTTHNRQTTYSNLHSNVNGNGKKRRFEKNKNKKQIRTSS